MTYTEKQIRLFSVFFSLFLSFFAFVTDDIINRDGILYINMAQAYLDGGLAATSQYFDWPFFSILIAYLHKMTPFSLESSAYLLNGLLFALLVNVFIMISNKILPNTRQLTIAALLILGFGILNEYRDFIIRDAGYWAFCSLMLYRFMIFVEKPTLSNATIWQITAVIAVLFRIEGSVIVLGLPLYLFFIKPSNQALKQYFQLNYLLITGLVFASIISSNPLNIGEASGVLSSNSYLFNYESYLTTLNQNMQVMETQILNQFSENYSGLILISGLLMMLVYELLIEGISLIYLGLYVTSWWQKPSTQHTPYARLLFYFIVINIAILTLFVLVRYFISTRYCMMTLLGLLLLMLPRVCAMIESLWLKRNKTLLSVVGLVLFISLADSMTSSRSKSYIKNTAVWASANLPEDANVLTDDQFIEYYFSTPNTSHNVTRNNITTYLNYDYLIVVEKRKDKELKEALTMMNVQPVFNLADSRGNKASVYKVLSSD
ncbi:MAG: hypothetical protein COA83_08530 [Methylophaga sp.]|nr:MAG: hypothetical protein COA83_08530 [Methylophaga sp.]